MMKLIERLFVLALLAGVAGSLVILGYFWYKSGQPMQVAEAQRRVPGITFREFWASRVEQWEAWDVELKAVGKNGACVDTAKFMFVFRLVLSGPFIAGMRAHQGDVEYTRSQIEANNGAVPPPELLYETSFLDAWWAMVEESNWWAFANDPGIPVKALNQRRVCSTTYPTPAPAAKPGE